jgi:hypothetical protein
MARCCGCLPQMNCNAASDAYRIRASATPASVRLSGSSAPEKAERAGVTEKDLESLDSGTERGQLQRPSNCGAKIDSDIEPEFIVGLNAPWAGTAERKNPDLAAGK